MRLRACWRGQASVGCAVTPRSAPSGSRGSALSTCGWPPRAGPASGETAAPRAPPAPRPGTLSPRDPRRCPRGCGSPGVSDGAMAPRVPEATRSSGAPGRAGPGPARPDGCDVDPPGTQCQELRKPCVVLFEGFPWPGPFTAGGQHRGGTAACRGAVLRPQQPGHARQARYIPSCLNFRLRHSGRTS
jgi:hypothetical protein